MHEGDGQAERDRPESIAEKARGKIGLGESTLKPKEEKDNKGKYCSHQENECR